MQSGGGGIWNTLQKNIAMKIYLGNPIGLIFAVCARCSISTVIMESGYFQEICSFKGFLGNMLEFCSKPLQENKIAFKAIEIPATAITATNRR